MNQKSCYFCCKSINPWNSECSSIHFLCPDCSCIINGYVFTTFDFDEKDELKFAHLYLSDGLLADYYLHIRLNMFEKNTDIELVDIQNIITLPDFPITVNNFKNKIKTILTFS